MHAELLLTIARVAGEQQRRLAQRELALEHIALKASVRYLQAPARGRLEVVVLTAQTDEVRGHERERDAGGDRERGDREQQAHANQRVDEHADELQPEPLARPPGEILRALLEPALGVGAHDVQRLGGGGHA